jgi:hypothetical protein
MWLVWIIVINRNKGVRNLFLGDNAIRWQRLSSDRQWRLSIIRHFLVGLI